VLQGLALGGEWAGAALLTAEYAPPEKRGWYSMFPQFGPAVGLVMSSTTFLVAALAMSPADFAAWGWRLPFLASLVLVGIGVYIRLMVEETPVFTKASATAAQATLPFADALRHQWKQVLLTGGTLTMTLGAFYIGGVFLTGYAGKAPGVGVLGLDRPTVLTAGIVGGLLFIISIILSAHYSDLIGRRNVMLIGTVLSIFAGPAAFLIMKPGNAVSFFLALGLLMVVMGIPYGPAAAYLPEIFHARYRYTGAGMGYNLAGILGGAVPLIVAPPLVATYGGIGVGYYLAVLGLISTVCVLAIGETKHRSIDADTREGAVRLPLPAWSAEIATAV
jgi:MFS family permease